jgi:eukaryotic-like serine/threonine-protein kinase
MLEKIGDYRLVRKLGEGGMGDVYLAVSPTAEPVALKMIHPHLLDDLSIQQRFADEVDSLKTVFGTRVARLENADPYADPPWLATEFIPGLTLRQYVKQEGVLPLPLTAMIGAMLAEGLAKVHQAKLLHRDLKPQNIILGRQGPVLIDFGLAVLDDRAPDSGQTVTGMVVGTPAYMAPEQARGEKDSLSAAVDVYGLGATLVYALTGHTLYHSSQGVVIYQVGSPDVLPDLTGVPAPIGALIRAMLAFEPQSRPSLAEVRDRLIGVATSDGRSVEQIRAEVEATTFRGEEPEIPVEMTDPVRDPEQPQDDPPPLPPPPAVVPATEPVPAVDVTWLIEKLRRQYARRSTWEGATK